MCKYIYIYIYVPIYIYTCIIFIYMCIYIYIHTVTSLVPSGKVPSTWTSSQRKSTPDMTCREPQYTHAQTHAHASEQRQPQCERGREGCSVVEQSGGGVQSIPNIDWNI